MPQVGFEPTIPAGDRPLGPAVCMFINQQRNTPYKVKYTYEWFTHTHTHMHIYIYTTCVYIYTHTHIYTTYVYIYIWYIVLLIYKHLYWVCQIYFAFWHISCLESPQIFSHLLRPGLPYDFSITLLTTFCMHFLYCNTYLISRVCMLNLTELGNSNKLLRFLLDDVICASLSSFIVPSSYPVLSTLYSAPLICILNFGLKMNFNYRSKQQVQLLGACEELRILTLSCLSVCLHVCPSAWNSSVLTGRIFMKFRSCVFFENMLIKFNFP